MPRLISTKNLKHPTSDGYVLSSSTAGVQSWVDNRSVGISSDGTSLGNMTDLNFQSNRVKFDSNAGVATVYTDPLTVIGL